jgi:hypothetical protein
MSTTNSLLITYAVQRQHLAYFNLGILTNLTMMRISMNRPPPPPPRRTSSTDTPSRKSLSENRMVSLPLRVASSPSTGLSRPGSRYSVLEIKELKKRGVNVQEVAADIADIHPLPISGTSSNEDHNLSQNRSLVYSGARNDYSLGDKAKCTSHMIIQDDPQEAFNQISRLKQHDFAFVKRTDGMWTYAILAHRYIDEGEECMMFVMHQIGSTKTITKRKWVNFVHLVADKMVMGEEPLESSLPRTILEDSLDGDAISRILYFS